MIDEVTKYMNGAINKYGLIVSEKSPWIYIDKKDTCRIFLLKDYNFIELSFINLNDPKQTLFYPKFYLEVLFGQKRVQYPQASNKGFDKDRIKTFLTFYNQMLLDYFQPVISGDFSWEGKYFKRKQELSDLDTFIWSTPNTDSIRQKQQQKDPTWEDDARVLYNKLNP